MDATGVERNGGRVPALAQLQSPLRQSGRVATLGNRLDKRKYRATANRLTFV